MLTQLNILCTSAVKLHYAERNDSPFMRSRVPAFIELAEKFLPSRQDFNLTVGSFAG